MGKRKDKSYKTFKPRGPLIPPTKHHKSVKDYNRKRDKQIPNWEDEKMDIEEIKYSLDEVRGDVAYLAAEIQDMQDDPAMFEDKNQLENILDLLDSAEASIRSVAELVAKEIYQ